MTGRQRVATLVAVGTCLGLHVATAHPVQASVPTPGIITTYTGGGLGSGPATAIPQLPRSLAISGSQLYVSDYAGVVRVLDTATGIMTPVAGNRSPFTYGDGGPATSAAISRPSGVALDSAGNLYMVTFDGRVRKVAPTGIISTFAGGGSGPLGDGGPATSATLSYPYGVAAAAGNVFIADTNNHRIRKVDSAGVITTVAGGGNAGDGGPAIGANLNGPNDVWADSLGNLLIADTFNNRIRLVDHTTGIITTVAGGSIAACSEPCPATSQQLSGPAGIWANTAGDYWIAESGGHRVRRVDHVTKLITTVAGTGTWGFGGDGGPATSALMESPSKAVTDGSGNLYISDSGFNDRVRRVDALSGLITTVAGNGRSCGRFGDGGQAALAMLCSPNALAVDGAGNLSIADDDRVRQVNGGTGIITTVAGGGGGCVEPCPATNAKLFPQGLAATASGDLFIADQSGNAIHKVSGGTMTRVAGTGAAGYTGDGGPATSAQLQNPMGVAIDSAGNVFIADYSNNAIRRVDNASSIITTATTIPHPTSVAVDSVGNLYFTSRPNASTGQGLYEWVKSSGAVVLISSFDTDHVAVGPGDRVAFGVMGANGVTGSATVFLVTSSGLVALAGNGNWGFSGDGGPATSAQLYNPHAIAFDVAGDFFIASAGHGHVRRVQAYTAPMPPQAVNAIPGDNSASVQWYAPANNGGLPVVRYTLMPHAGATAGTPIVISAPSTSYALTGLANGTSYTYTVTASNAWGASTDSSPSNSVTPGRLLRGYITTHAGDVGVGAATSIGQYPVSLAIGPVSGTSPNLTTHLYVGDWANSVVRDLVVPGGQEGVLAGVAATAYAGDRGPATAALIDGAGAVAYCDGNTWIADTNNYVIRKIDSRGVITTVAGTGMKGFNGDGMGTSTQIGLVFGLACISNVVFIADSGNGRIRQLGPGGQITTMWRGFAYPTGLVVDPQGTMYVADSGSNRVWRLGWDQTVTLLAGGGYGCADPCLAADSRLRLPWSVALDSAGRVYIADTLHNKIRMVYGGYINLVAGDGTAGFKGDGGPANIAQLRSPYQIVLGPGQDELFVADSDNRRIRRITSLVSSPQISTIAGNGTLSWSGDGGQATSAQLGNPYAVAVDAAGNEYIADNQNDVIRKIDVNGVITTVAGNATTGFSGDGGLATLAALNDPRGIAVSAGGDLYITDTGNQRVRKVDSATGIISTIAGNGVAGFSGDAGPATIAMINAPRAAAVDASGNVYVADTANNRVRKITGGIISTVAGTGTAGFTGDGASASAAQLNRPRGLAINTAGDVFISDTGNNRVRVVNGSTGIITTIAGNGVAGFGGDGYAATSAALNVPFGLALDGAGSLYVADANNHRIRVVDPNGIISTAIGTCAGRAGFSGDWGPASIAQVNLPYGVAVGLNGNVLVADTNNNRIRRALGLVGLRGATCQGAASEAGPRDTNQSAATGPATRLPEVGGSRRMPLAGVPAASQQVDGACCLPSKVGAQPAAAAPNARKAQLPATVPPSKAAAVPPPAVTTEGGLSLAKPAQTAVDPAERVPTSSALYLALLVPAALLPLGAVWWHRRRRPGRRLTTDERQSPRRTR